MDRATIDYMMSLLDWNKSDAEQEEGRRLSTVVKDISVFLQPCQEKYDKNVWDNCAKILAARSDAELKPYLTELFVWLQDMNWPGSLLILERLKRYADMSSYQSAWRVCFERACLSNDEIWIENLREANIAQAPDVEVVFSFNGVRKRPAFDGYRPAHLVKDDYLTTGTHHYYGVDTVAPEGTAKGTITFITPEYYPHCLWIGKVISIQEGSRAVGCATITRIFNSLLEKESQKT